MRSLWVPVRAWRLHHDRGRRGRAGPDVDARRIARPRAATTRIAVRRLGCRGAGRLVRCRARRPGRPTAAAGAARWPWRRTRRLPAAVAGTVARGPEPTGTGSRLVIRIAEVNGRRAAGTLALSIAGGDDGFRAGRARRLHCAAARAPRHAKSQASPTPFSRCVRPASTRWRPSRRRQAFAALAASRRVESAPAGVRRAPPAAGGDRRRAQRTLRRVPEDGRPGRAPGCRRRRRGRIPGRGRHARAVRFGPAPGGGRGVAVRARARGRRARPSAGPVRRSARGRGRGVAAGDWFFHAHDRRSGRDGAFGVDAGIGVGGAAGRPPGSPGAHDRRTRR